MLAGTLSVGGVPSATVMVCTAVAELPALSVAVNVRVMTRGLEAEPTRVALSPPVTFAVPQFSNGGPLKTRSPLPSRTNWPSRPTTGPLACDGLAVGTSLRQGEG